ncbi:chromate transporter [Tannockella kyphosi]|uniref:chromate transporter n=1 Tax=Tannockella kyphosi TaxID=2899121 RepID=UPI002011DCEC|nr:chromate transporter [Tannockella kyphosi]
MILMDLFISFVIVGMFSFGGGMAAIPLIQEQVVTIHQWLSLTEFTDLITIAQMTPGPIAINCATFVGIQIDGLTGALVATIGCVLPSCIIVSILAWLYVKYKDSFILTGALQGLQPAVVALIATAGLSILLLALFGEGVETYSLDNLDIISSVLFIVSFAILKIRKKTNPIHVMIGCGIVGGMIYLAVDYLAILL